MGNDAIFCHSKHKIAKLRAYVQVTVDLIERQTVEHKCDPVLRSTLPLILTSEEISARIVGRLVQLSELERAHVVHIQKRQSLREAPTVYKVSANLFAAVNNCAPTTISSGSNKLNKLKQTRR